MPKRPCARQTTAKRLTEFRDDDSQANQRPLSFVALTFATDESIDDFWSAWGDLEIPYAGALDRLTPIPVARDPNVADGLFDLDVLIRQAIADLA
jgi:hypothetical protein